MLELTNRIGYERHYITTHLKFGLSHNTYLSGTSFDDNSTLLCCFFFTHDA